MKFEYEEFSTIEEFFLYLVSVAPYMKQVLPASSYKGYVFSILPLTPVSGDILMMVYSKGSMDPGLVEFDISTKKYKPVSSVERADKRDRKSTRLNSSHRTISYAVFCLKKKKKK